LGLVSGLFWVPGATAGIYGIRNAGLAISVGTWSSNLVITSVCWGGFIFHEKVKSIPGAIESVFVLIVGLIGMSIYSAPTTIKDTEENVPFLYDKGSLAVGGVPFFSGLGENDDEYGVISRSSDVHIELATTNSSGGGVEKDFNPVVPKTAFRTRRKKMDDVGTQSALVGHNDKSTNTNVEKEDDTVLLLGGKIRLSRRQLGIIGAIINGTWGGNNMIPLHYARYDDM
jgi:hypothetical protein